MNQTEAIQMLRAALSKCMVETQYHPEHPSMREFDAVLAATASVQPQVDTVDLDALIAEYGNAQFDFGEWDGKDTSQSKEYIGRCMAAKNALRAALSRPIAAQGDGEHSIEHLKNVRTAALNLLKQRGRRNTESAYKRLEDAFRSPRNGELPVGVKEIAAQGEQDARYVERYRYLRSRDVDTIRAGGVFAGQTPENFILSGDDLDAAIDAAIQQAKPAGEQS